MKDQANPVLIMIAAILMAAVTVIYVVDRSIDPARYESGPSSNVAFHPPS